MPVTSATVRPGAPNTLEVSVPDSTEAGDNFSVTITVLDAQGNVVTNYSELDREILLNSTGTGELSQTVVSSGKFENGEATLSLTYTRAEDLQIVARERSHVAAGQSVEFTVRPGSPAVFETETPSNIRAGNSFNMTIKVLDEYGNRIRRYEKTTNGIRLQTTGLERPQPEFIPASQFENGQMTVSLRYTVAESMQVVLVDESNGIRSLGDTIDVHPAPLNNFTLSVPQKARAGVPFRIAVEARDRYGNIVGNYSELGQGAQLSVPGGQTPEPSFIPPEEFEAGVAFVQVTYNRSGPISFRIQDRSTSVEGESSEILIQAGPLASYEVSVPDQVRAGNSFDVTIRPVDQFGNSILNYSSQGDPVVLSVRGIDQSKKVIEPNKFSDGKYTASFAYTDAEPIRLKVVNQTNSDLTGQSESLVVTPGQPGDVMVDAPEVVTAGKNFTASLTLTDDYGNVIQETGYLPGKLRVSLINGGSSEEDVLTPSEFIGGQNQVVFRHETAETVSVHVEYQRFDIRKRTSSLTVTPGKFHQLAVSSPGTVQAGSSFSISMTFLDRYGNEIQQVPEDLSSLQLVSTGSGNVDPKYISRSSLTAPTTQFPLNYYIAENTSIKVLDGRGNRLGVSAPMRVKPGKLASFGFQLPDRVSADNSFTLRLQAKDSYGNLLTNLDARDGFVRLENTGEDTLDRTRINFSDFANGVSTIDLKYREAETIRLIARTNGIESTSSDLTITPGAPAEYQVLTQETVEAGRPFPAVIRAYDQYENPITDLPDDFHGVQLASNGSDRVSPYKISATQFDDGEANVFLAYPKAGEIDVSASPLESSLDHPLVDRFYISRDVDTATLYILASGATSLNTSQATQTNRKKIQVELKPANLLSDARTLSYNNWFLKRIEQRQTQYGSYPIVGFNIFPNTSVNVKTVNKGNLYKVVVTPETTAAVPSLETIQKLMQQQKYQEAKKRLDSYLDKNPADQTALKLRLRLKRLLDLVGS
jgi:S-adenosylmethionine hydrolase